MKLTKLILTCIIPFCLIGQNRSNDLDLDFNRVAVADCLDHIETLTDLKFSFDSKIIDDERKITYQCSDRSLEKVIQDMFDESISTKRVGNHVVLIKNLKKKRNTGSYPEDIYLYKGVVLDSLTGQAIANASIYHLATRKTTLTDAKGLFTIRLEGDQSHEMVVGRKSYAHQIIFTDPGKKELRVSLMPSEGEVEKLDVLDIHPVSSDTFDYPFGVVPEEAIITTQNLEEVDEVVPFQISLLPGIGSHWMTGGITQYNFSVNILAGYSRGIKGMEIGGGLNICTKDIFGFQAAGILNSVAGQGTGFQAAGISNRVEKGFRGFQVAGIANRTQVFEGMQVAGIYNELKDSIVGMQMSGGVNIVPKLTGAQVSGVLNKAEKGEKIMQVSGVVNMINSEFYGIQVAGVSNHSIGVEGIQVAGIANMNRDTIDGIQISGILNKTKVNKGVQVGLINVAEESNGISIGLVNWIGNGMKAIEVGANEVFFAQLKFKHGQPNFYIIYSAGLRPDDPEFFGGGLGVGSRMKEWNKMALTLEAGVSYIHESQNAFESNFNYRLETLFSYQFGTHFMVLLGPSINYHNLSLKDNVDGSIVSDVISSPWLEYKSNRKIRQYWMGGSIGIQYLF